MPLHEFPKHSQRPAPEKLRTIAVPRDSVCVWGVVFAVCCGEASSTDGSQHSRTRGNQDVERGLSRVSAVPGFPPSLSKPEFWDLANYGQLMFCIFDPRKIMPQA